MSDYGKLTAAEQDTYDEYCRLRQVSDWPGFDADQKGRKDAAGQWIKDRRAELQSLMKSDPENNKAYNRQARYDYLGTTSSGSPARLCQLPTAGGTDAEKSYITEREVWWRIQTDYDAQKARKQACTDWLVARRKYVWQLAEGKVEGETPGWDTANRQTRYYNLQVATKYGSGYDDWAKSHDTTTGKAKSDSGGSKPSGGNARDKALSWMANHRGITEDPVNSNCDNRKDGIRTAQDKCAGSGTWLRYQPWCGVWCFNALAAAGVKGLNSNMASVAWIESQAKAKKAPFTSWTTNGGDCKPGDLVVLFGSGTHVGMVREVHSDYVVTEEGNTSVGNNGGSAQKQRSRHGDTYGYARVAFPS